MLASPDKLPLFRVELAERLSAAFYTETVGSREDEAVLVPNVGRVNGHEIEAGVEASS
ncbi:hypothetical protein ANO14919_029310 [Xylariales sp. No.14919]|nr:hypothetical protein ANO14919_029310 [Xylariales sp. No.14919]